MFEIIRRLCKFYLRQGELDKAEKTFEALRAQKKEAQLLDDESTLGLLSAIAEAHYDGGKQLVNRNEDHEKLRKAESSYKLALGGCVQLHGPKDFSTVCTQSRLGRVYKDQHRFVEAQELLKESLALLMNEDWMEYKDPRYYDETRVDPNLLLIETLYNLGGVYEALGRTHEAKTMFKRVLDEFQRRFNTGLGILSRPGTTLLVDGMKAVASSYQDQSRFQEVEVILQRVLHGYPEPEGDFLLYQQYGYYEWEAEVLNYHGLLYKA